MPWDEAEARGLVLGICREFHTAPFAATCQCGGTFLQHHLRHALDALDAATGAQASEEGDMEAP